ncbi:MAG: hypothetical protein HRU18_02880 [Pseudoalteromonas sp.]|uniref:hypothetical protein n=1 Tax=Pseudoalteromonas sp. TaxID=53249 RepID=UPI001DB0622F|nr:hypothetical protein [Pseudoalteromonas sp.]NRA77129.1 hypothetical protein [Pseudoalteromonas sp.]
MGIVWLGSLSTAPIVVVKNEAYYNTIDKKSYIWTGEEWEQMTEDGRDGAYKSTVFRNGETTPPNPPQDGTYDGDGETAPTDWTIEPLDTVGTHVVWASVSRYFFNGTIWTNTIWSDPSQFSGTNGTSPIKDTDFFDGSDGAYVSSVYKNAGSVPIDPIGGTFTGNPLTEVFPSTWTDNPQTPIPGQFTWISVRRYSHDASTNTWTGGPWSASARNSGEQGTAPVKGVDYVDADGNYTSYVFRNEPIGTSPTAPTDGSYEGTTEVYPVAPVVWTDNPTTPITGEYVWVTKTVYRQVGGVWQPPTWSTPAQFSGDEGYTPVKGIDYQDGKDGSYTSYIFKNSIAVPVQAFGGTYDGSIEIYPTNWIDDPVNAPAGQTTYMSKAKYINTGTSLVPVWARETKVGTTDNWTLPVQFTGVGGADGTRGSKRYYAVGTVWSDGVANNIITGSGDTKIEWDVVTISGGTFAQTKYWSGSSWVLINEVIDGNLLVDGTILGTKIHSATTILAGSGASTAGLNGSTIGIYDGWRIWSGNATPAFAPFRVDSAGKLWATGVDISGTVRIGGTALTTANTLNVNTTKANVGLGSVDNSSNATIRAVAAATSGTVAGWTINSVAMYSGTYQASNAYTASGITIHKDGAIRSRNFRIDTNGNAFFKGDISGASGTFTGALNGNTITGATITGSYFSGTNVHGDNLTGNSLVIANGFIRVTRPAATGSPAAISTAIQGTGNGGAFSAGYGVQGAANGTGTRFDFYASGTGINYGPFTGGHDGLVTKGTPKFEEGDIVCDIKVVYKSNMSNAICEMLPSSKANQKGATGVLVTRSFMCPMDLPAALDWTLEEHVLLTDKYDRISFNALGEGLMNVCGEGGDFEIGDLIVTSSMLGKGMKQSDDLVRGITVAKIRENVTFKSPKEVRQVAVIYLCG